jgi:Domain of unknown function (DUF4149)
MPRTALALLLLAMWLGGATVVATTVAPAAFAVLPTRALAGALVGRVLPQLFHAGMLLGAIAAALAWTDRAVPHATARAVASLGTVLACAVAQWVIGPRIARLREVIGPSVETLATTDPLRVEFGRLHGLSVLAMGVGMVAALVAIVLAVLALRPRG